MRIMAGANLPGLEFEWDRQKAADNARKHGVTFSEAAMAFTDPLGREWPDVEHSDDERRITMIGESEGGKLLVVVYTRRRFRLRIISGRRATRRERQAYEQQDQY